MFVDFNFQDLKKNKNKKINQYTTETNANNNGIYVIVILSGKSSKSRN